MADLATILDDLTDEGDDLDRLVAGLDATAWARSTPAAGWTVADQVAHLAWTDDAAILSATVPERFAALLADAWRNPTGFVDDAAHEWARTPSADLLGRWRAGRARLAAALVEVPAGRKLDWFGPPMSAASMATARLMETWAHGQDVADALASVRAPTHRLRHVAHLGVRTRDFAYTVHDLTPPAEEFRVELLAPDESVWTWGPDDAAQRVTATALDFCLLVTQRRNRDDLDVTAVGPDAQRWIDLAQAFAGPPGNGRAAGQFDAGAATS
ncbi:TIGR03084 family metal-binding protein [Aldersonia sp. NBC_00410]|uniref:TIGR03084 family metal-binding protein n=1 Tax=Aldersonia sp. NBC_00410 TaxID=2975954 RepID=UPI0022594B91|nr:TIGR03084 family metal-binding protein [Aldersonia sp. NBC_00410]MCX5045164.1 TIGR03084 family metal-binding protein [Aldersonia sp. NBC_00410]